MPPDVDQFEIAVTLLELQKFELQVVWHAAGGWAHMRKEQLYRVYLFMILIYHAT